jgi:hypothetical protein
MEPRDNVSPVFSALTQTGDALRHGSFPEVGCHGTLLKSAVPFVSPLDSADTALEDACRGTQAPCPFALFLLPFPTYEDQPGMAQSVPRPARDRR